MMDEFFKPWQMRIGCVTLLMALAIVGLWGWNQNNEKSYSFSTDGRTEFTVWLEEDNLGLSQGQIETIAGFTQTNHNWWIKISHWSIALPLSLISAWFLILKPRPLTQQKTSEPTANEGM